VKALAYHPFVTRYCIAAWPQVPILLFDENTHMLPQFRSRDMLIAHMSDTMWFYHPRCVDPSGGFFHFFLDDGTVYDRSTRHLVSSTRFVFNSWEPVMTYST
jgi:hypothetical protein